MPWKDKTVEELRKEFVEAAKASRNFSSLCREFGISRKTGYKWVERNNQSCTIVYNHALDRGRRSLQNGVIEHIYCRTFGRACQGRVGKKGTYHYPTKKHPRHSTGAWTGPLLLLVSNQHAADLCVEAAETAVLVDGDVHVGVSL